MLGFMITGCHLLYLQHTSCTSNGCQIKSNDKQLIKYTETKKLSEDALIQSIWCLQTKYFQTLMH